MKWIFECCYTGKADAETELAAKMKKADAFLSKEETVYDFINTCDTRHTNKPSTTNYNSNSVILGNTSFLEEGSHNPLKDLDSIETTDG